MIKRSVRPLYLLVLSFCVNLVSSSARADEEDSLRISRPTFRMPQEMRFFEGRPELALDHFALWTRNYLRPVVCSSVLCGGSCAAYLDSCPSFSGLAVLDFTQKSALETNLENGGRCPVNVPRGLVASDGCGSSSCNSENESSAKDSCCKP